MVDWMGGLRWVKKESIVDADEDADDFNQQAYFGPIRVSQYYSPLLLRPCLPTIVQMRILATAIWGTTWHGRAAIELGIDQKQLRRWEDTDPNTMRFRGAPPIRHVERLRRIAERQAEGLQYALAVSNPPLYDSPKAEPVLTRLFTPSCHSEVSDADGAV
jgi:hypothetical protein